MRRPLYSTTDGDVKLDAEVLLNATCDFLNGEPENITIDHLTICIDGKLNIEVNLDDNEQALIYLNDHYASTIIQNAYYGHPARLFIQIPIKE